MAVSLYAFLGLTIYMIWKNIEINTRAMEKSAVPVLKLSTVDVDLEKIQEFNIPEVIIGRDPECDFSIPRETISAHHARLSYHHKNWWIEDMLSTNGTFLNEGQVSTPTVLVDGDTLQCGDVSLSVNIAYPT
jgi:hypothetical protein